MFSSNSYSLEAFLNNFFNKHLKSDNIFSFKIYILLTELVMFIKKFQMQYKSINLK
jgi:hypothetical protein